jgi:hypothetical protein
MELLIKLAGLGQIGLALGSVTIPYILWWNAELSKLSTLIRRIFWTYAVYIFSINMFFGVISLAVSTDLLGKSALALYMNGLMAVYWISRLLIQFFYFKRDSFPKGKYYTLGEVFLTTLFVFFSGVYGWIFASKLIG